MISIENLDYIKAKIKDLTLMSFRNYNANIAQHLSNKEFEVLKLCQKIVI